MQISLKLGDWQIFVEVKRMFVMIVSVDVFFLEPYIAVECKAFLELRWPKWLNS